MAKIFCFSSTGNSLYVAKKIADRIDAEVVSMSKAPISCGDDVIGFVFPVYFWGLPKIVEKYVQELQISDKNAYIFAMITYGGKVYGVQGALNRLLQQKGVSLQYSKNVKSVENYIPGYKVNNHSVLHQKVDKEIDIAVNEIIAKRQNKTEKYTFVNEIVFKFFPGKQGNCDMHFAVAPNCTGCGTCQKICPVNNVALQNGKPVFLHKCEHCLACMHVCPTCVVDWKKSTQNKERYHNPQINRQELISFSGSGKYK